MSESNIKVKGMKELSEMLQTFPEKLRVNILRSALRAGANVVKEEVKVQLASQGHVETGQLRDGVKVATKFKGDTVIANVKMGGKHSFVANWLEFTGAAPHRITGKKGGFLSFGGLFAKSVQHPGFQPKPFMRPALDGKAQEALVAVAERIKKRLTKAGLNAADVEIEVGSE